MPRLNITKPKDLKKLPINKELLNVDKRSSESPSIVDWKTVTIAANWSANLFSDEQAAAKWIGAEVKTTTDLSSIPEHERQNWLLEIHDQLLTVCREMVETGAERYVDKNKGWRR